MPCKKEIALVEMGNDPYHKQVQSSLPSPACKKFEEFKSLIREADQKAKLKPLIQRVPFMLRGNKNFEKYYKPRVVSIGPLHHGNSEFKPWERFKVKLAALFVKRNSLSQEHLYEKIKNEIGSLRRCYDEDEIKSINDEDLSWVFFVDGCALLHYIDCVATDNLNELRINTYCTAFAGEDLFLLENQLPYKLLNILISSCNYTHQEQLKKSISEFISMTVKVIRGPDATSNSEAGPEEATHLLELLWKRLVTKKQPQENAKKPSPKPRHSWYSYRNVNELKAAGINFQPKKGGFLNDFSFICNWFTATLILPSIIVDDATKAKFLNLIAYEMCPDFDNDFEITTYMVFLCSLIHQPRDVKELRNAQILHNFLGSDKEIAKLFNEIGNDLVPYPETLKEIWGDVQDHCENILTTWRVQWKTWQARLLREPLHSPWTFLGVIGGMVGLLYTGIQTLYTIKSAASSRQC